MAHAGVSEAGHHTPRSITGRAWWFGGFDSRHGPSEVAEMIAHITVVPADGDVSTDGGAAAPCGAPAGGIRTRTFVADAD